MPSTLSYRRFCFTCNHYDETDINRLKSLVLYDMWWYVECSSNSPVPKHCLSLINLQYPGSIYIQRKLERLYIIDQPAKINKNNQAAYITLDIEILDNLPCLKIIEDCHSWNNPSRRFRKSKLTIAFVW